MTKLTKNQQQVLTSLRKAKVNGIPIHKNARFVSVLEVQKAVENKYGRSCTTSAIRHTLDGLSNKGKVKTFKLKSGNRSILNLYS